MAMELRALFLLPLCFPGLQGQAPEAQRRREGGTLYIQCSYAAQTEYQQAKFWCLLKDGECEEILRLYSYEYSKQSRDGRIKINDDTAAKTVSITMTDLKAEDSGTYFCAIYKHYNKYPRLRTISLHVFKELLRWELDTLAVQCPAGPGMAWCQGGQTDCTVLERRRTSAKQSDRKPLQDRVSMQYNAQGTLVTMKNLQSWDSGVYWCARDSGHTRQMEVVLSVFKRTQQHTAEESGYISVQCHYKIADYSSVSKAWCKKEGGETCKVLITTSSESPVGNSTAGEGVRIQDDTQQGIVTITMEQLRVQDSGVYWCALQDASGLFCMEEVTLSVSKALSPGGFPGSENQEILLGNSCSGNTFLILSMVLLLLLLLALLTSVALGVRYYRLLLRTGNREAEDTSDRAEGTAQPGSSGKRESSQHDSKGPAYINLEVQSPSSLEDPLYCNVEPSQAPRNPQHVEYAVIAFSQSPRTSRE